MKDLPSELAPGLAIAAVPPRASPADVLIFRRTANFVDGVGADSAHVADGGLGLGSDGVAVLRTLSRKARVGTSSPRRAALLRLLAPEVEVVNLRGNLDTRLGRVARGDFEAVVVAAAGLERLAHVLDPGMQVRAFDPEVFVPAPAQGLLAVMTREDDAPCKHLVLALEDKQARIAATAERAFLVHLAGGCAQPVGCWFRVEINPVGESEWVCTGHAFLAVDATPRRASITGAALDAAALGIGLAVGVRGVTDT